MQKLTLPKTSVLFNKGMQSKAVEKLRLENDLQGAIDNRQLYLNYQPIVSLDTGKNRLCRGFGSLETRFPRINISR